LLKEGSLRSSRRWFDSLTMTEAEKPRKSSHKNSVIIMISGPLLVAGFGEMRTELLY